MRARWFPASEAGRALKWPFVDQLKQDHADQGSDGTFFGEDAHGRWIGLVGERAVGAPVEPGPFRIVLDEGGGDESGDDAPVLSAGVRKMHAATLTGAVGTLTSGHLHLIGIGHNQLDAARLSTRASL